MRLLIPLMMVFMIGCSSDVTTNDNFIDDAIDFYVLMIQNGGQTEELDKVYENFLLYNKTEDPLFINVVSMYEAFGDPNLDAEVFRYEVTKIINE